MRDLDGVEADDVYEIVLREMEIPLFVEVLNHCEGNQSRAAAMLGIHRATLRRADICGVAPAADAPFTFTDGGGAIWSADEAGLRLRARHDLAWDNHLVRIG